MRPTTDAVPMHQEEAQPGEGPAVAVGSPLETLVRFEAYMAGGGSLRQLFHIDPLDLEVLYAYGCKRYREGDYEGARQIYLALVTIDPRAFDYWLALGLAMQKMQRHDEAIACFARTAKMRLFDPRSSFFAGVSFQLQGDLEHAREAFGAAIKWCGRQQEYRELREQAEQALQALAMTKPGEKK